MKEDGEIEDGLPSGEEAEEEPQPEPLYDPLTEPWNDPASTSVIDYRLSEGRKEFAPRPGAAPHDWERTYPHAEELSELRRRLREETVTVPKRAGRGSAIGLIAVGFALFAWAALPTGGVFATIVGYGSAPSSELYYINLGAMMAGALSMLYGIYGLVFDIPLPTTRVWRDVAETALLAALIFVAVAISMQNFKVEGASMEPSLDNDEYLIVNKLAYAEIDLSTFNWLPFFDAGDDPVHHLWGSPARGDVIVFRSPTNVKRDFIKRIIGVPGDVVKIDREIDAVVVNGEVLDEPYINGKTVCSTSCGPWTVPERSYFVMGDNRSNSSDSRQGWFVPEENIIGKALITYWHEGSPDLDLAPNHDISFTGEAAAKE